MNWIMKKLQEHLKKPLTNMFLENICVSLLVLISSAIPKLQSD